MHQAIHPDKFRLEDWDIGAAERVFVSLLHAKDWKAITGEAAPNCPPTAQDYAAAGLPWFDWFGKDQAGLPGSERFSGVTSVASKFKAKTGATLPNSQDVATPVATPLGPNVNGPRPVRTPRTW
jgi:hypothetical protein